MCLTVRRLEPGAFEDFRRANVDQFVESTGTDRIFEVVVELGG